MFKRRARTDGAPRRNTYLIAIMAMGAIVTAVGGTGIFAVFTDRATTSTNTVESGTRPKAADIQLAVGIPSPGNAFGCSTFEENLTTQLWSEGNLQPGDAREKYICVKNNGAASVNIAMSVSDLVSIETQCSGDEASVDLTCGSPGAGELESVLQVKVQGYDCGDSTPTGPIGPTAFNGMVSTPFAVTPDPLPSGAVGCAGLIVIYDSSTPEATIQAVQSDQVSWKFAFDATAL